MQLREKEIIEEILRTCRLLTQYKHTDDDFKIEIETLKSCLHKLDEERDRESRIRLERKISNLEKRRLKYYKS